LSLEGEPVRLDAFCGGKAALVSLWATWCEACAGEFAALERLDRRVAAAGGKLVAVAVGEPRQRVQEFVKWRGLAYPQLVDERFQLSDALGLKRVPTTLVVDPEGRIVFTGGALDEPAINALSALLNRRP
jgi:peroxiredoxin